jgi:hypothetical protein
MEKDIKHNGIERRVRDLVEKSETIRYYMLHLRKEDYKLEIYRGLLDLIKESDFGRKEAKITIKTAPFAFFNICNNYLSGYGELSICLLNLSSCLYNQEQKVKVVFKPK